MALLLIFAFVSGFVTALTPCVLPILPIVFSSTLTGGKRRPLGLVVGLIVSFTFFTLTLTTIVKLFNFPGDLLRYVAIVLVFMFGLVMVVPRLTKISEKMLAGLSGVSLLNKKVESDGFWGGFVIGLSLGLLWVPCAGPILAAVIALASTQSVTFESVLITFAYVCGSSVVLLLFVYGGREIVDRFKLLRKHLAGIPKIFGLIMIITSFALVFNIDRKFQIYIVQSLPGWVLTPLSGFESSATVVRELQKLRKEEGETKMFDSATLLTNNGVAPEFVNASYWFNSDPITLQSLKGKVVLIDFWTYSCVNCIRTMPYVESWYKKYKDKGFTVVGVHSPEFAFERNPSNVEKAIRDFGLTYPVFMDNDFGTWNAYKNRYWPAHYLIDGAGNIRRVHFGEGDYENMERAIQLLLEEQGVATDFELTKDNKMLADRNVSPETYVGYSRLNKNQFMSGEVMKDVFSNYSIRDAVRQSSFGLEGSWNITSEYAEAKQGSVLKYRFVGQEINLVMGDGSSDSKVGNVDLRLADSALVCTDGYCMGNGSTKIVQVGGKRVKITVKGTTLKNVSSDVVNGDIFVRDYKLYNLGKFTTTVDATFELEFLDDGVKVFAFTFG